MIIKRCPICNRLPKIIEGCRRANGNRFYMMYCPNYHLVLRRHSKYDPFPHTLYFEGDYDYNTMYKVWNEEIESE